MEDLADLPFLDRRVCAFIEQVQDDYQAGYPPMSPITVSFYMHWLLYDVRFGADRETIGEWLLGVSDLMKFHYVQVEALRNLCNSRIGIFEARPRDKGRYGLRELITGKAVVAVIPSTQNKSHAPPLTARLAPPLKRITGQHDSPYQPHLQ